MLVLFFILALSTSSFAMNAKELIGALEKAGASDATLLKAFPLEIEEKRADFLGSGVYLRVTVDDPHHASLRHFVVGPDGRIYRVGAEASELERMRTDLKLSITDANSAVRYAQWVLEVSQGESLWLLSSVKDVPFRPVADDDTELAREVEKAKASLTRQISPPSANASEEGFVVTQEAVHERKLVRYSIAVSKQGQCKITKQTLTGELPVVWVL